MRMARQAFAAEESSVSKRVSFFFLLLSFRPNDIYVALVPAHYKSGCYCSDCFELPTTCSGFKQTDQIVCLQFLRKS